MTKIWIKKDYKENSIVITFKDPKEGEINPVLYVQISDEYIELDTSLFYN